MCCSASVHKLPCSTLLCDRDDRVGDSDAVASVVHPQPCEQLRCELARLRNSFWRETVPLVCKNAEMYSVSPILKTSTSMSTEPKLYGNFINGAFSAAADGTTIDIINPATNGVVGRIPRSKAEDVDAGTDFNLPAVTETSTANPKIPAFCAFQLLLLQ